MSWLIIMFLYPKKIYMLCNDLVNLQGSRQLIYTVSLPLSFLNMTPLPWLDLSFALKRQTERKHKQHRKKKNCRDFPGHPVVKTSPSNAGGEGSIPGWVAKIPHALWPKNQNIKQKQHCNKFNKDFKNGPHPEKSFKK